MLENDVALVTGASRGIGHAIALALAAPAPRVIGTATSAEGAATLAAALASHGYNGRGAVLDVGEPGLDRRAGRAIWRRAGEMPTILVNNAAITRDTLLLRMKPEDWDAVIATNLTSVFRLSKACLRRMMKERRGRIVNLTSIVGLTGNAGQANYAAAKAGILGFTKSLAQGGGLARHHRECGRAGLHRHRHDSRAQRRAAHGAPRADPDGPARQRRRHRRGGAVLVSPRAGYITGRDAARQRRHVHGLSGARWRQRHTGHRGGARDGNPTAVSPAKTITRPA